MGSRARNRATTTRARYCGPSGRRGSMGQTRGGGSAVSTGLRIWVNDPGHVGPSGPCRRHLHTRMTISVEPQHPYLLYDRHASNTPTWAKAVPALHCPPTRPQTLPRPCHAPATLANVHPVLPVCPSGHCATLLSTRHAQTGSDRGTWWPAAAAVCTWAKKSGGSK